MVYDALDDSGEWPTYTAVKSPKLTIALIVLVILVLCIFARYTKLAGQITCNMISHEKAQKILKDYPNLDRDGDGIACE